MLTHTDTLSQAARAKGEEKGPDAVHIVSSSLSLILSRINPLFLLFAKSALVRILFLSTFAAFWFHDVLYLTKQ